MKKVVCLLTAFLLLTGCSQKGYDATKEDALEISLDAAKTKIEEAFDIEVKEEEGYDVEFSNSKGHYSFHISDKGIIQKREFVSVEDMSEEEQKVFEEHKKASLTEEVEEKKENTSKQVSNAELTEAEKKAVENAISNAGVTKADTENGTVQTLSNGNIEVQFTIIGGNTVVTLADSQGRLISSTFK